MFTGIIADIGTVCGIERQGEMKVSIRTAFATDSIDHGASIACDGACLTVVETGPDWFAATVSAETLACTTLGDWEYGARVNLERSLRVGDELGGHLVSGHVDGIARLRTLSRDGDSRRLEIEAPKPLSIYIARKGSIALAGVSLTVNDVDGDVFCVNIIPHTWMNTSLGDVRLGALMNVEVDMLARYIARRTERLEAENGRGA